MPRAFAAAAATGVLLTAGCSAAEGPAAPSSAAGYQYSCCRAADVTPARHPGEVVTIHWIVRAVPSAGAGEPVTLTVRLNGPFDTVDGLKGSEPRTAVVTASPVHTTDRAGGHPTSRFTIPADAKPGYYDLVAGVVSSGDQAGSGSVIRVVAAH